MQPGKNTEINSTHLSAIVDGIERQGYIVLPSFIPDDLINSLQAQVASLQESDLKSASVGRGQQQQNNSAIRRDKIHWLSHLNSTDNEFLALMEALRNSLNQVLYLGLFDYECHYAVYQKGDFYKTHHDALKGKINRVLSMVIYLNKKWNKDDGGELIIYNEDEKTVLEKISPKAGTIAIFLSEQFPHEVLAAKKIRYSIAGWFRVNASGSHNIDPAI